MAISIVQHRIAGVPFKASPNHGGAFAQGMPDALIIHFTGGSSADSSVNWLCNPQAKASAHVVVGRDGSMTQLVAFDTTAWHAGQSSWGGRSGYNRYSIGIEIDYPGRLHRTEGGSFVSSFGKVYPPEQVISAVHRNEHAPSFWLVYSEAQVSVVMDLCAALCATYSIREILGHEEIAPGRKDDPGPAFPLDRLRQRLILRGRDSDEPFPAAPVDKTLAATPAVRPTAASAAGASQGAARGYVTASRLNFRAAPRIDAAMAGPALVRGTVVMLMGQQPGWYQVRSGGSQGWVKAEYVKT